MKVADSIDSWFTFFTLLLVLPIFFVVSIARVELAIGVLAEMLIETFILLEQLFQESRDFLALRARPNIKKLTSVFSFSL